MSIQTLGHLLGESDKDFGRRPSFIVTPKSLGEGCRDICNESVFFNRSIFLGDLNFESLSGRSLDDLCSLLEALGLEGNNYT